MIATVALGAHYLMLILAQWTLSGHLSWAGIWDLAVRRFTEPGDASRYLDIAKNGYVKTGENAINLVFYPLYPYLMRVVGWAVGSLPVAGVLISQISYCVASVLLYELILLDGNVRNGWDGVLLMALYPFSVFVMGIFTEGLFLALTLGCLYALRKQNMAAAGCIGFLAALTRTQGMLLIFPAVYELVTLHWGAEKRKGKWNDAFVLLIPAGFGVYLLINYLLHGNCFQFLRYEANAPWFQSTRWIGENIAQHYQMAHDYQGLSWFIYWLQLILYFLVLAVLLWGVKQKTRGMYVLYGGVYLGFSYLSGWMISGGRYMLGCVPIFIILSQIRDGLFRRWLLFMAGLSILPTAYSILRPMRSCNSVDIRRMRAV